MNVTQHNTVARRLFRNAGRGGFAVAAVALVLGSVIALRGSDSRSAVQTTTTGRGPDSSSPVTTIIAEAPVPDSGDPSPPAAELGIADGPQGTPGHAPAGTAEQPPDSSPATVAPILSEEISLRAPSCTAGQLTISVVTDKSVYGPGETVTARSVVTNTAASACFLAPRCARPLAAWLGPSGEPVIVSAEVCGWAVAEGPPPLDPGESRHFDDSWNQQDESVSPAVQAAPGRYSVVASGAPSVTFELVARA